MKKVMVLFAVLFGFSMMAHAVITSGSPQQTPSALPGSTENMQNNTPPATANDPKSPANNAERIGGGSGDDADTVNDADPSNDKDPEADDDAGSAGALPAKY